MKKKLEVGDLIDFQIEKLDLFGQGVCKKNGLIIFIPKTLPREKGVAKIIKKSKGVYWAHLLELSSLSPQRKESECPHFTQCQGCSYLHTSYENELNFKKQAFTFQLNRLNKGQLQKTHGPSKRLEYRNRIQLHYNVKKKKIGYHINQGSLHQEILEVPNCLIPLPQIQTALKDIYQQKWWLLPELKSRPVGHLELSIEEKGQVNRTWNKPYASSGFEQVNREMNSQAKSLIAQWIEKISHDYSRKVDSIDLFGGNGNLSDHNLINSSIIVDQYSHLQDKIQKAKESQFFLDLNLYSKSALKEFQKKWTQLSQKKCDILFVDPPRSGFKNLLEFTQLITPQFIVSMSCHSSTFIRDMQTLQSYHPREIHLFDFFPGTSHFEVLGLFEKSSPSNQR